MKYSELLNKPYKKEMVLSIAKDLSKYYPKMEEKEVNLLANEIYVICISKYYKVNLEKIIQMLEVLDNSCYFMSENQENGIINSAITDSTAIHIKTIIDKYIREIQKRI